MSTKTTTKIAAAILGCMCTACAGGESDKAQDITHTPNASAHALMAELGDIDAEITELAASGFSRKQPENSTSDAPVPQWKDSFLNDGTWYDTFADA
ncbi:hypothetical protein [Corallococcus macrosporus]|uniref:hypothetical protein n=1 Tax=Corallococcus macrosporus TaxID=35 RepID=UPI000F508CB9|nr:hypothetical protein [Corallococcus macrosporus]